MFDNKMIWFWQDPLSVAFKACEDTPYRPLYRKKDILFYSRYGQPIVYKLKNYILFKVARRI